MDNDRFMLALDLKMRLYTAARGGASAVERELDRLIDEGHCTLDLTGDRPTYFFPADIAEVVVPA